MPDRRRGDRLLAVFDLIRRHGALASAVHCAFDLLELDGRDLRREPIEKRKALLAKLLRGSQLSIVLNKHFEEDGAIVMRTKALGTNREEPDYVKQTATAYPPIPLTRVSPFKAPREARGGFSMSGKKPCSKERKPLLRHFVSDLLPFSFSERSWTCCESTVTVFSHGKNKKC